MAAITCPLPTVRSSHLSCRGLFLVLFLGLFSILFSAKTLRCQQEVVPFAQESSTTDDPLNGHVAAAISHEATLSNKSSTTIVTNTTTNTSISLMKSEMGVRMTSSPTKAPVDRLSVFSVCGVPNALLTDSECQKQFHNHATTATTSHTRNNYDSNASSLVWDLDCFRLQHAMEQDGVTRTVNFIATANKKYEGFLPSYAFSALSHNNNSVVEFIVEDHTKFIQMHAQALAWLLNNMGENQTANASTQQDENTRLMSNNRICVRSFDTDPARLKQAVKNTWRFLETPVLRNHTEYTYIGDIDVYMYESVLHPYRLEQMSKFDIPYSNIVRPNDFRHGEGRLTGLILMKTKQFYTTALIQAQQTVNVTGNDERILYRIVKAAGLGLPPNTPGIDEYLLDDGEVDLVTYRPVHGLHLSLNRGPYMRMCQPEWTEYRVRWTWCAVMKTPRLAEFWCHDLTGRALMQQFIQRVQKQIKGKFQKIDGNCTPSVRTR